MSWPRRPAPGTPDGERAWKRGIEKQIKDLQKIRNPPPPPTPPPASGGTIPFLVAAADAPAEWKAVAAYQCDQTDDAVTIQAAVDAASGHTVTLSPGAYYMPNAGVNLGAGESVRGDGYGTLVYGPDSDAAFAGSGYSRIEAIRFSYYDTGTGAIGVSTASFDEVIGCWFEDGTIGVDLASASAVRVVGCTFASLGTAGITDTSAQRPTIKGCRFDGGTNIDFNGARALIADNDFNTGSVQIDGDECLIAGNHFGSTATLTFGAAAGANAFASNYMVSGATTYTDNGTGTQKPTNGNYSSGGLW